MIAPALFFFLEIAFAIWSLLCFHTNFKITCSSSVKNAVGNLTVMDIDSVDCLG